LLEALFARKNTLISFLLRLHTIKDIKQEIMHTLLLKKYGVSRKWVIIMDRRQDANVTSTPSGKSGPSAQDRYCARGLGGGAKKRRANEEEKK